MSERQEQRWAQITARMEDGVRLLEEPFPEKARFALSHFAGYVRNNELELAWDALYEAGDAAAGPKRFWECLAEAAAMMGLEERRAEALRRTC